MSFERAIEFVLSHEGELADHPADRGKRTRWGVSSKAHPEVDLDTLTRDGAIALYRRDYWARIRGDALPWPLGLVLLDHAVHSGAPRAVRTLQGILGVQQDGVIGRQTLQALAGAVLPVVVAECLRERADALVQQGFARGQRVFLFGWVSRLLDLALEAGRG